jgi:hypothetical protein
MTGERFRFFARGFHRAFLFIPLLCAASPAAGAQNGAPVFNAGADLRIRQEIMRNVPGLPGGGVLFPQTRRDALNHMRFRPRVWAELAAANWRLRTRLTDEVRWNVAPDGTAYSFPDELVLDNLFLEGTDLFDGRLDVRIGRQDLYNFCGLDHVFVDGTPGDGSRTLFADMVKLGFSFENEARLDLFFLHCGDENALRWGTARSRRRSLAGLGGGADPDMDDWGWGAVWSGRAAGLPYQVFALQKVTESFRRDGREHPWTRRELAGVKLTPQITDDLSLQLEAMGQIGRNGDGDWLSGWSTYSGLSWRRAGEGAVTPFMRAGFHTMSGARDAADEDGGHRAWDPMWSRGVNDSELFLYGTHYGVGWWSNMMFLKFAAGA